MNAVTLAKFVIAWFCIVAVLVILILLHAVPAMVSLAGVLCLLAIAASLAPPRW